MGWRRREVVVPSTGPSEECPCALMQGPGEGGRLLEGCPGAVPSPPALWLVPRHLGQETHVPQAFAAPFRVRRGATAAPVHSLWWQSQGASRVGLSSLALVLLPLAGAWRR